MGVDCAAKTGRANDLSAIAVIGVHGVDAFVLDVVADRVEFVDLLRMLKVTHARWAATHLPVHCYVEDASAGTQLVQTIRTESQIPVVPITTGGKSKIARVEALTPFMESGHVLLPTYAPWLSAFEEELLAFPAGRHDDRVDAFSIALAQVIKPEFVFAWSF